MERKQSRASGTSDVEDLEAMEINDSSKYSSSKKWEWSYLRVSYPEHNRIEFVCFIFQ